MPTFEEFVALIGAGGLVLNTANPPIEQRDQWIKNKAAMQPHFDGTMPAIIMQAFPNETAKQLNWREKIHRSESMPRLQQAIEDVRKLVMGGRFVMQASADFRTYLTEADFEGLTFDDYLFEVAYPARVLDPNGLLAVLPNAEGLQQNEKVNIELRIIDSEDIYIFERDLVVCIDRYAVKYQALGSAATGSTTSKLLVFADYFFCKYDTLTGEFTDLFIKADGNEFTGAYTLGGNAYRWRGDVTHRPYKVFRSDFYKAIPPMDSLELLKAQLDVATVTNCFPHRLTRGLECQACKGKGKTPRLDPVTQEQMCLTVKGLDHAGREVQNLQYLEDDCNGCKGKGTISIGALDSVDIPANKPASHIDPNPQNIPLSDYITYIAPEISTIDALERQFDKQKANVDEALNLTKPANFAESGVAKEKDREGKETALMGIATGIASLAQNALEAIIRYRENLPAQIDAQIAQLNISPPINFDIVTEGELEAAISTNSESKPVFLAAMQAQDYVARKREGVEGAVTLFDMVMSYTNGLVTLAPNTVMSLVGMGAITEAMAQKAILAMSLAQTFADNYLRENEGDPIPQALLYEQLDGKFAELFASPMTLPRSPENMDNNGRPE